MLINNIHWGVFNYIHSLYTKNQTIYWCYINIYECNIYHLTFLSYLSVSNEQWGCQCVARTLELISPVLVLSHYFTIVQYIHLNSIQLYNTPAYNTTTERDPDTTKFAIGILILLYHSILQHTILNTIHLKYTLFYTPA